MSKTTLKDSLLGIANVIADNSNGKIRLAFNEQNESKETDPESSHFLKIEEKRFGRDLEIYGLMGLMSSHHALTHFLEEIVMPLKKDFYESYYSAMNLLQKIGQGVFIGDALVSWNDIFETV